MSLEEESESASQRRFRKQLSDALKRQQIEEQRKDAARQFLEPAAYDRLMNIRISNQELYAQLVNLVLSLAQSGRLRGRMSEQQLKEFALRLTRKPEPRIEFKRK